MKLRVLVPLILCALLLASCRKESVPGDIELPGTLKLTEIGRAHV